MKKFQLTTAEKRLIREYYRYRKITVAQPKLIDILQIFSWDDPLNERYVPIFRDWAYDDQQYVGAWEGCREAIRNYLKELDAKNENFFKIE